MELIYKIYVLMNGLLIEPKENYGRDVEIFGSFNSPQEAEAAIKERKLYGEYVILPVTCLYYEVFE